MISVSEKANKNYLAKIVKLITLNKHPNADRLQVAIIDFQNVITGLDAKVGDLYVYFPVESQINSEFLSATNSFRDKELNKDKEQAGFFEKNGRVRAVKLRGEQSCGYIVPIKTVEAFVKKDLSKYVGQEFDMIGDIQLVKKYVVKVSQTPRTSKQGKKPRISRLVEGQVHLHIDTENFRKNAYKVKPNDTISVTYKVHGTSFWVSNVLVKKPLCPIRKIMKFFRLPVRVDTEYDYVYGSRRVVKNEYETQQKQDFYGYDLWGDIKEELKEFIPKGYTLYGECVGFTKDGKAIQKDYDYGCVAPQKKIFIYRITITNEDGFVTNLSTLEVEEFCKKFNLNYVPLFYYGEAGDMFDFREDDPNWTDNFVKALEKDYNEKYCYICNNKVPEEGIVIRKESIFQFEAYKLKSFSFLERETKQLDKGEENMEDNQ